MIGIIYLINIIIQPWHDTFNIVIARVINVIALILEQGISFKDLIAVFFSSTRMSCLVYLIIFLSVFFLHVLWSSL